MPFLDQFIIASSATPNGASWDLVGASFDLIEVAAVPVQTNFALLVSVLQSPEEARDEHRLTVTLRDPNGVAVGGITADMPPATESQVAQRPEIERARSEAVLTARGAVFPSFGRYELHVEWDGVALREPMALYVLHAE